MFRPNKLLGSLFLCALLVCLFSAAAYAEGVKAGEVTGDQLNLREAPGTSSAVITQLPKGAKVQILETSDGWHRITYNDLTGWVSGTYVSVQEILYKEGVVNGNDVNVRSEPNTSAKVLTTLNSGTKVKVYESSDGWHRIEYADGQTGWMFGQYLIIESGTASRGTTEEVPSNTSDNQESGSESTAQKLIEYAKSFLGVKYVYGGSTPKGFDCSGFVKYVFDHFGIKLERVAADQAAHGTSVSRDSLVPGDLVFFDTNGGHNNIGHVGIYIGDGKFIHASSGRTAGKVVISDLKSGFYNDCYMKARRYLK